ncbi:glycosyltransferase [Dokdonia sinensis]|uniref:Glycosyltransferase n=1 Tax=Dokdonia sinensis TaxID=2479847 RepID=A0A3M0G4N1_9FLAO|nr:glycosyltransferase [Dokdonia sinensis]RMB59067.1 glycosyltransferase [Dokdonia sinensis]
MILYLHIIIGIYTLLLLFFIIGFNRTPIVPIPAKSPKSCFSIIIAFRNEAVHLPALLQSLSQLQYPRELYEIFLVNDSSEDTSSQTVLDFIANQKFNNIHLLENIRTSASPKKDAIRTAIHCAQNEWILTTDADCLVPATWLLSSDSFIQAHHPELIAAPVTLATPKTSGFLYAFESLDIHSLLGATIGAFGLGKPFMANGANLCYRKVSFLAVNGFDGNDHIASGDDIFILEKFLKAFPQKVMYLKHRDVLVKTSAQTDWGGFISQRVRWAAKATGYSAVFPKVVGVLVFWTNLTSVFVVLGLFITLLNQVLLMGSGFAFAKAELPTLLFIIFWKFIIDAILIWKGLIFTDSRRDFTAYPIVALLYPFVSVYVAMRAFTGTYRWKGRQFKQ